MTVSEKLANGRTFKPDFEERIQIVHDQKLKYVQFDVIRDSPPPTENSQDANNNIVNQNAFDVLMRTTAQNTRKPKNLMKHLLGLLVII